MHSSQITNNALNSGRRGLSKEKGNMSNLNKTNDASPNSSSIRVKNVVVKQNITNMQMIRSLKNNKRAGLQSAKVASNINNTQLLFLGVNSPKIKNDLSSQSILPPITNSTKNKNSIGSIPKKQFSDKNPFSESISTNATALNSNQIIDKNNTTINIIQENQINVSKQPSDLDKRCRSISPFRKRQYNTIEKGKDKPVFGENKKSFDPGYKYNPQQNMQSIGTNLSKFRRISKAKSNVGRDQPHTQHISTSERRNIFNDSKHHFESIEDSIAEENFDELDMDSSAKLNLGNRFNFDNYSFAYNSDVGAATQFSGFKTNSKINIEKKINEMSIVSSSFGQSRFKNAYLESSFENPHKIFINEQDQLHVIMEKRKPRKSKNNPSQQIKKKEKINNFNSNYRKRVMEVEKQKKMIQEIEERYKEYSTKLNPYRQNDK